MAAVRAFEVGVFNQLLNVRPQVGHRHRLGGPQLDVCMLGEFQEGRPQFGKLQDQRIPVRPHGHGLRHRPEAAEAAVDRDHRPDILGSDTGGEEVRAGPVEVRVLPVERETGVPEAAELAIPDYDTVPAIDVVMQLADLDADERSRIEIYRNGQRDLLLEAQWSLRWKDIYIGSRDDLVETTDALHHYHYQASQGAYDLVIPAEHCYLIDTDSTVENLAAHIAGILGEQNPGDDIRVCAYEGVGKGAVGISFPR